MASAPPRSAPIFLVAPPRSGAEALRHVLNLHPAILIAPEFDFLAEAITPAGRLMKRDAFIRSVEFDSRFKRLGLAIAPGAGLAGIAQGLLDQIAASKPEAPLTGATLQHDFDRILWLWPDARFIHLVRDGRDVAMANVRARRAGNLWHGIAEWAEAEALWDRMSHKLPPDRQYTIKYETIAAEPEYEIRRLCQYLRLPVAPQMLEQAGVLERDAAGRWRKADLREISAAEHRAARWLLQNSYFLSGTVRPPSILRRAALNLQNKAAIANHRREQLGTGLWLRGGLITKLGSRKAKARMKRRQYDILSRNED